MPTTRLVAVTVAVLLVAGACAGSDPTGAAESDAATTSAATPTSTSTASPSTTAAPATTGAPATTTKAPRDYDFSAISPVIQTFVDDNGLNGAGLIVVHRDDGIVYHEHWGEFDEDRISLIASSSKMITAGVVLHLADQGLLDIDAAVADAVDWGTGNPAITPAQLVSNSSGFVGLGPDVLYGPYLCQFGPAFSLQECGEAIFTTAEDDADVVPPDTEFRYGGAQWQVAGAVAEAVSGKPWDQLIDEIYVQPCELDALAYNNPFAQLGSDGAGYPTAFDADPGTLAPSANPNMEAGAYVTTGDYGELLLMHLRDGTCGDTQVLSTDSLARMHGDRTAETYGDVGDPGTGYGMGWWIDRESGRISDGGAFGSQPWLDLDDGYGVFLVIEATADLGAQLAEQLYDPIDDAVNGA